MTKRNPIIAALLSAVLPGCGQIYNGQKNKTILFYSTLFLLPIVFVTLGLQYRFWGLVAFVFALFTLYVINIADALLVAIRAKDYQPKPLRKWPFMLLLIFFGTNVYAIATDGNVLGVRAFVLPASSMAPALEVGDYIMVGMKHDANPTPARGEIVMFHHAEYPLLIKRIVAVGGDVIEGREGKVYLNGNRLDEPHVQHIGRQGTLDQFNRQHATGNFGPITVPANHFFVIGDNRDNSFDSRDPEFGLVAREAIKGKPLYIYWARNKARIGREIR